MPLRVSYRGQVGHEEMPSCGTRSCKGMRIRWTRERSPVGGESMRNHTRTIREAVVGIVEPVEAKQRPYFVLSLQEW